MKEIVALELDIDLKQSISSYDQFIKAQAQVTRQIIDIREENKKLNKEIRDQAKQAEELRKRQAAGDKDAIKDLEALQERRKRLSEQLVENTKRLKDLSAEQRRLNTSYQKVDEGVDAYKRLSAELRELRANVKAAQAAGEIVDEKDIARVEELDKQLKEIDGSVGQFQRNVGNYQSAFDGIGEAIRGNFGAALEQVDIGGFSTKITGLIGKFPALAGVIGVAAKGFIELAKFIANTTLEYERLRNEVFSLTGATGAALNEVVIRGKAIADTFQAPFEEVVRTTNVLTKELTGDFSQSLDLVTKAALALGPAFTEGIDQLQEYATQAREAGASGEELLEILILSTREGIFSDKGIDTVKEAGLRLREQADATVTALQGAFGDEFSERIFKGINDGSITTIDALKEISQELDNTQVPTRELQALVADLFGGAGEDAGLRFIQLLKDVDGNIDDLIDQTDAYTQRQYALLEANTQLNQAQNDLASQFTGFGVQLQTVGTNIKTAFIGALSAAIRQVRVLGQNIAAFFDNLFGGDSSYVSYQDLLVQDLKVAQQEQEAIERQQAANAEAEKKRRESLTQSNKKLETQLNKNKVAAEGEAGSIARLRQELSALEKQINETASQEVKLKLTQDADQLRQDIATQEAILQQAVDRQKGLLADLPTLGVGIGTDEEQISLEEGINRVLELTDLANRARVEREKETQELLNDAREEADEATIERRKEIFDQQLEQEKERLDALVQLNSETIDALGSVLGDFFSGQTEDFKDFQKQLLLVTLDALEKAVQLYIIEAQVRELAKSGIAGVLKGAILVGVIKALFAGARGVINRFEEGGVLKGPSHSKGGVQLFSKSGAYYGEAEGGEPILTKGTSRNKRSLGVLSKVNQMFGGKSLGGQPIPSELAEQLNQYIRASRSVVYRVPSRPVFQTGGVLTQPTAFEAIGGTEIDYERLGDAVARSLRGVTIVTEVQQVRTETERLNQLEANAREI